MAAGLGFKDFTTGEVLTAADVDGYLMQGVWVFADAAARTAAVTSPQEGNVSFLKDTNSTEYYSGSAWVAIGGSVPTSLEFTAGKNKIINGDFNINQRAFTSNTTSGLFNFDRWVQVNSGGTTTVTPQTFTPGSAPVAGYEGKTFIQIDVTGQSANSDRALVNQKIESVRTLAGQTATVSFWAKASSGTPSIAIELAQDFGSGGSPSSTVNIPISKQAITTSWARYTATVSVPSISGKTLGTAGDNLNFIIWLSAGSDFNTRSSTLGTQTNTFQIWGVQVEAGSTATAFQTATGTFQGELAACQRYYQKSYAQATAPATNSAAGAISLKTSSNTIATAEGYGSVFLPVTMRTAPTVTIRPFTTASNTGRVSNGTGTDLAANSGNALAINETKFSVNNNTGGTLTTVELIVLFHYEASSEL